ncbi:TPA: hypothetical protein HA243_03150 [Candidatus Micrarchaeota archaeon]|nr:hypothetical protein [Candidatus Micrarchaeota archaeon]
MLLFQVATQAEANKPKAMSKEEADKVSKLREALNRLDKESFNKVIEMWKSDTTASPQTKKLNEALLDLLKTLHEKAGSLKTRKKEDFLEKKGDISW